MKYIDYYITWLLEIYWLNSEEKMFKYLKLNVIFFIIYEIYLPLIKHMLALKYIGHYLVITHRSNWFEQWLFP